MGMAPGRYMASVVAHGISQNEGKSPQLWITFQNEQGHEHSWFWGMGFNGRGQFGEKGFAFGCKALTALGWNPEEHGFEFAPLALGETLLGLTASIVVEEETYDGKSIVKVKYINDPNEGPRLSTIDPAQQRGFFEQLRANAFKAKAGGGQARPAQQQQRAAPKQEPQGVDYGYDDQDIPFALLLAVGMSVVGLLA